MGFIQPLSWETETHLGYDTAHAVSRTEPWTLGSLRYMAEFPDSQAYGWETRERALWSMGSNFPLLQSYSLLLVKLLAEWRNDEEQFASAAHVVTCCTKLHWQACSRARQVAKSKPCLDGILTFSSFSMGRSVYGWKVLSFLRPELGPGFQRVPLLIVFH